MQNTKLRSSVSVVVEELDIVRNEDSPVDEPVIKRPRYQPDIGLWWEALVAVILIFPLWKVFGSWNVIWERPDVEVIIVMFSIAISIAAISGNYEGPSTILRKALAYVLVAAGLSLGLWSLTLESLPKSSLCTSAAVGLTISGWAVRRMLGEKTVRCISLGILATLPLGLINDGFLTAPFGFEIRELVDQSVFWYTSVLADLNSIPHAPFDDGIRFATGELKSAAVFGNLFGLLVALGASLSLSVLSKQSLLVCLLALTASFLWWIIFRSGYCVNMATSNQLDGPLKELAMPSYAMLGLLLVTASTNLCLGAILAPIEIDPAQSEVSALTQLYNALVSFPQLGQSHSSMHREIFDNDENAAESETPFE